ncbi:MAG: glycosyltransferase family 1 protein [Marinilabiliaceae bacterium]|nr:glycosyltransferase family 1 protein [Marinilabiliaceae bacterium]
MSLKLVKITSYYKDFLSYYYEKNTEIIDQSYSDQHQHLMKQRFAWSDAYADAFSNLGYNAHEIVANARPLQKRWCEQNNQPIDTDKEIVIQQLKKLKPEVVWMQDSYTFNGVFVKRLRKLVPSIRLVIGNCCSPISPQYYESFKAFDLITVCAPYFKALLESNGLPECLVIPHAFDHRILEEINCTDQVNHDFLFTGSIILDQQFHNDRIQFLEALIQQNIDINLLINLNQNSSKGLAIRQAAYVASRIFKTSGLNIINQKIEGLNKVSKLEFFPRASKVSKSLSDRIKSPVFGLEMFREIANSKIAFNVHGDIASNFAANMRMYEVTGMGTCLLTDWKPDIDNYFKPDEEIVTYKSLEEAKEKVTWLLNNPTELKQIGLQGQKRTLQKHTFESRAKVIDSKIKQLLSIN